MISHATRMPPNEQDLTVTQSGVTSVQSAPGEGEADFHLRPRKAWTSHRSERASALLPRKYEDQGGGGEQASRSAATSVHTWPEGQWEWDCGRG